MNTQYKDFTLFDGCFGNPRISPTDIDGMVERRGKFFTFEYKPEGKPVSQGQFMSLDALARQKNFTVSIIYHEHNREIHDEKNPTSIQILPFGEKINVDKEIVRKWAKTWTQYANNPAKQNQQKLLNFSF